MTAKLYSMSLLFAFEDLRGEVEGRPACDLALRVLPEFPGPIPGGSVPSAQRPATTGRHS